MCGCQSGHSRESGNPEKVGCCFRMQEESSLPLSFWSPDTPSLLIGAKNLRVEGLERHPPDSSKPFEVLDFGNLNLFRV
jgi:hypothetical protein